MESENKNVILVAYDFTQLGDVAIENAVRMAKLLNYKVCLLHIINKASLNRLKKTGESIDSITNKLESLALNLKNEHNVQVDVIARKGSIFTSIAEVTREIGASYLIFGTHGKMGIQFLLGSFALKLIKSCPVPVFVVQKSLGDSKYADVVFPLNMDPGSKQKVKWAIMLYKQFKSTFHIYVDTYPDEFVQRRLRADLNQVKKLFEKHDIPYTETQSPSKGGFLNNCLAFTKEIKADLIMISTDPDKITWNLFGSPDERMIYNLEKIPVMCINAQDLKIIIGGL
jgi:nucleotide-binding universal stress UspA family protein